MKERYENFHKVKYSDTAIRSAVYQSNRYITDRFFPDKAIDILDEAGAKVKLRRVADTQNLRRLEAEIALHRQGDEEGDLGQGLREGRLPARARDRAEGRDRALQAGARDRSATR